MMQRFIKKSLLGAMLIFAAATQAQQLRVSAPVIAAEPIYAAARSHCDVPAPPASQGLGAALQWDIKARCRVESGGDRVVRWRVQYQWDRRTFTIETKEKPADHIPIVLTLN